MIVDLDNPTGRAGGAPLSVLELLIDDASGSYATVTPEQPLTLHTDAILEDNGGVLPLAIDGELFLPLGLFRRCDDGGAEIRLERLPTPAGGGSLQQCSLYL